VYHPTSRALAVLELLQSRAGLVSGIEIAHRLETDVRTIRRYILKLQDVGIPIDSVPGRAGGYRLKPGHRLPPLLFTPEEGMAAFLALMGSSWLELGQESAAVEGALSKIARVMPQETRQRLQALSQSVSLTPPDVQGRGPEASLLFDLSEAVQGTRCVEMTYGAPGKELESRVVEPCGLVGLDGNWYLVAWCRSRKDFRTFRLDRIDDYTMLPDKFVPRKNFDFRAYARAQLVDYPRKHPLVVWFSAPPDRVKAALPSGWGTAVGEAGGTLWTIRVDDLDWAVYDLLKSGLAFQAREPEALREALRTTAARALDAVGGSG